MNDIDVSGRMGREQFEELSHDLFERLRHLLQELLHNASMFSRHIFSEHQNHYIMVVAVHKNFHIKSFNSYFSKNLILPPPLPQHLQSKTSTP